MSFAIRDQRSVEAYAFDGNPLEMICSSWPPTSPDSQGNRNDTFMTIIPEYRAEALCKLQ